MVAFITATWFIKSQRMKWNEIILLSKIVPVLQCLGWNPCRVNKDLESIHTYMSSVNVHMETSAFALIYFHCLSSALSCNLPPVGDDNLVVSGLPDGDDAILPDRFLRFSCKRPGTALKGRPMVICGKDGQWDSPFPTCEGKASHENISA